MNQGENQPEEVVVKRGRGRPKKADNTTPDKPAAKKTRGRPAKYAPEERAEKYKELTKKWLEDNQDIRKEYLSEYQKNMMQRFRTSYSILIKLWNGNQLEFLPDDDKQSIKRIIIE